MRHQKLEQISKFSTQFLENKMNITHALDKYFPARKERKAKNDQGKSYNDWKNRQSNKHTYN